jgi:hypothetical protein
MTEKIIQCGALQLALFRIYYYDDQIKDDKKVVYVACTGEIKNGQKI